MKKIFLLFMGLVLFSDYAFAYEEIDLKRGVFRIPILKIRFLLMRHNLLRLLIFYF